ncbi:hypothetical protein BJX65DRAFT_276577 [Aspergillus insuetus]
MQDNQCADKILLLGLEEMSLGGVKGTIRSQGLLVIGPREFILVAAVATAVLHGVVMVLSRRLGGWCEFRSRLKYGRYESAWGVMLAFRHVARSLAGSNFCCG